MPDAEKFWDKTADKYSKSPIKNMAAYTETMDRTKAHLSGDDNALEIGCGTGSTALLLAGSVKHITATDISANMIEIANAKAVDQQIENVTFLKADVFDDVLKPEAFDAVLAFNVLHLMTNLPAQLQRVNALLRPGGWFISKSVCLAEHTQLWRIPIAIAKLVGIAPPVECLTFKALEEDISRAGFDIIETGVFSTSLPPSRFVVAKKI